MDPALNLQVLRLLCAAAIGSAGGLLYDLLRFARQGRGRAVEITADLLFCLAMSLSAFLFAMSAPSGRLGQWELAASLFTFLLWQHGIGPWIRRRLVRCRPRASRESQNEKKK